MFHSIKPLFSNKPILIICNKIDSRRMEDLSEAEKALVEEMVSEAKRISSGGEACVASFFQILHSDPNKLILINPPGAMSDGSDDSEEVLMAMSTLQEEGVMAVKQVGDSDLNLVACMVTFIDHFVFHSWRLHMGHLHSAVFECPSVML